MSLNVNTDSPTLQPGVDHISQLPGRDPIQVLPPDIIWNVFEILKAHLPSLALVSKNWRALADDEALHVRMRPFQAFGAKEWEKYIGDAGKEPRLPRRAYGDLEKGDGLLTFIPEIVKVCRENGIIEEVALDSLEAIDRLVENAKIGHKTSYHTSSWWEAITQKRELEKSHWVWINTEKSHWVTINNAENRFQKYKKQSKYVKRENKKISGARIPMLIDTTVSLFMESIRSGKRDFLWEPREIVYIRVKEETNARRIILGFNLYGIIVFPYKYYERLIGSVPAWKYFGTETES